MRHWLALAPFVIAYLAAPAAATTTAVQTDLTFSSNTDEFVKARVRIEGDEAAGIRSESDTNADGTITSDEVAAEEEAARQAIESQSTDPNAPSLAFVDEKPLLSYTVTKVTIEGLAGSAAATDPIHLTVEGKVIWPSSTGRVHTFKKLTESDDGGMFSFTVPKGNQITMTKGIAGKSLSADKTTVTGTISPSENIEVSWSVPTSKGGGNPLPGFSAPAMGLLVLATIALHASIRRRPS